MIFPTLGKVDADFFQCLEKLHVPISNAWKPSGSGISRSLSRSERTTLAAAKYASRSACSVAARVPPPEFRAELRTPPPLHLSDNRRHVGGASSPASKNKPRQERSKGSQNHGQQNHRPSSAQHEDFVHMILVFLIPHVAAFVRTRPTPSRPRRAPTQKTAHSRHASKPALARQQVHRPTTLHAKYFTVVQL